MNSADEDQLKFINEWQKNHPIDYVRFIVIGCLILGCCLFVGALITIYK